MTKKSATPTPSKKAIARQEEREFQRVLKTLDRQQQALVPPKTQVNLFYGAGVGVAVIPIALHITDSSYVFSNIWFFLIGVVSSAWLLSLSYNGVANKSRKSIYIAKSGDVDSDNEPEFFSFVQHVNNEATSYALFTVNAFFLVSFLLFALYLLRPYGLTPQYHFIASTTIPSVIVFGVSKFF